MRRHLAYVDCDIVCINLKRRSDRLASFTSLFAKSGPETLRRIRFVEGIDGSTLTESDLSKVTDLRRFTPPYFEKYAITRMHRLAGDHTLSAHPDGSYSFNERVLTKGAIGCALSHISIWEGNSRRRGRSIKRFFTLLFCIII